MMTDRNETPYGTAFTVSIEAREGISTGISAHDRARTIQVAIDASKSGWTAAASRTSWTSAWPSARRARSP